MFKLTHSPVVSTKRWVGAASPESTLEVSSSSVRVRSPSGLQQRHPEPKSNTWEIREDMKVRDWEPDETAHKWAPRHKTLVGVASNILG